MAADDYAYLFKVVFIGKESVGKTCLVKRFTHGTFNGGQNATIGVDFFIKSVTVGGETVKLQLWDTAGQERFRCITQTYYRSANAVVMVYDISSMASFETLPSWLNDVKMFGSPDAILCLVGNKSDLAAEGSREVPIEAGAKFAADNNMIFIETSAKDSTNVNEVIESVARKLVAAEASRIQTSGSAVPGEGQNISFANSEAIGSTPYDRVRTAGSGIIRGIQLGAKQVRSSVLGSSDDSFMSKASSSCCSQ